MKVLVTGGTGLIGSPTVRKLLDRGHSVRLLSRHAEEDAAQFDGEVEAFVGSIHDFQDICGCCKDCDAVVHIAGIVKEEPPDHTFLSVNVEGTRNLVQQAERDGVKRFIYVSSLGADRGSSDYHRSKKMAENIVSEFEGEWVILRPGNVYGPGDNVTSLMIRFVRSLPAVPVIDNGDEMAQPIWAGDLAEAIVLSLDQENISKKTLELAGNELISTNDMLDKLAKLLGKDPVRVPIPGWAAHFGTSVAKNLGIDIPFTPDQVTMLTEGNRIKDGENALITVFLIEPTPLDQGLRMLIENMPDQTPKDGVGKLRFQRFEVLIGGSGLDAMSLFAVIRDNPSVLFAGTPVDPKGSARLQRGELMTLSLPIRGDVQVRVVEETDTSATVLTVEGHPLAGAAVFECVDIGSDVAFRVRTYEKPSSITDAGLMSVLGAPAQQATWEQALRNVVTMSNGEPRGPIMEERRLLEDIEAGPIQQWIVDLDNEWKKASGRAELL